MFFTESSQIVRDFVLLINNNKLSLNDVPNLFNLREVVENVVKNQSNDSDN